MKGLLRKDFYIMIQQMRIFLFAILLLCVVNEQLATFAILYAAMMPYSTLAYDEQSQWLRFAAMTPCRPLDIVLSKYLLGWLLMGGAAGISLLLNAMTGRLGTDISADALLSSLASGCICLAILLPVMFRFGVERARMGVILFFVVIFSVVGSVEKFSALPLPFPEHLPLLLAAAAVLLSAGSVFLSVKLFQGRE